MQALGRLWVTRRVRCPAALAIPAHVRRPQVIGAPARPCGGQPIWAQAASWCLPVAVGPRLFSDGDHVDSVNARGFVFHAGFDAADERGYLGAVEVGVDVDACEYPYLAWADEGDEEFLDGGDAGVGEEECPYPVFVAGLEWLADEEVVVSFDEAEADAGEDYCDEPGGDGLG